MIEVIIFYCYLFLECMTGVIIFIVMLRRHNKRYKEEAEMLK
jgi:preprotein translocase subunit YajC